MPISTNIQGPTLIDLQPNRQFINPEFDGYKLSLDAIPTIKKELDKPVDKVFLNSSNQYTFVHVKLTGLHNHLVGETIEDNDYVYVIDKCGTIKKVTVDCNSEEEIIIENVINIERNEANVKNYNVCLKFVSKSLAVFSDGIGKLYILNTGDDRKQSNMWTSLYSANILNNNDGFIIQDAKFNDSNTGNEIHCLLQNIRQKGGENKFCTILYWVTFKKISANNWEVVSVEEINGDGMLYYAYLEDSCKALYIVSDGNYQFQNYTTIEDNSNRSKYYWSQDDKEITIKLKLPNGVNADCLQVNTTSTEISAKVNDEIVLKGKLSHTIEESLTMWAIENDFLQVKIVKKGNPNFWTHLIPDDSTGEYIVNPAAAAETQRKLGHLCSEEESGAALGTTFNSEEVEECDFEQDKYATFIRLSKATTSEITHKVNVNTHTFLFAVEKEPYTAPALVLRHDVDAYVWQPIYENDNFRFVHEGTLNALGYVQASKQQRKFSVCAPDLSYCAICESSRHLFIYKQKQAVDGGELRNRSNGRRVRHVAQQQVVNLPGEEILGIYAATSKLFLLTSDSIYVLTL